MKKIVYTFLLAAFFILAYAEQAVAAINLPSELSITATSTKQLPGEKVNLLIKEGTSSVGGQTHVEYGVARTIKNNQFTSFEIITAEVKDIRGLEKMPTLTTQIPNTLKEDATSTYVVYTKFFEKDNPDNESFFFTKEFSIVPNESLPFLQVRNINMLQSNGKRFSTLEGPTIYTDAYVKQYQSENLATTTSLEITFKSNQDLVLQPSVVFSKIRSNTFSQTVALDPIQVKKGDTYITIPMPAFEYVPGVYMGALTFNSPLLPEKIDFQYIVGGDSVSVGNISIVTQDESDALHFEIFGNPIDIDRVSATSTGGEKPATYDVRVSLVDANGLVLRETIQSVDFSNQDFSVPMIKDKFKQLNVASVHISVLSPETKKVVFETNRPLVYTLYPQYHVKSVIYIILWIILGLLFVLALIKRSLKMAIVYLLLLIGLFFARPVFALYSLESYMTTYANLKFRVEGYQEVPRMYVQNDIANTVHSCGEQIPMTFKIRYLRCANSTPAISAGFSWVSPQDAVTKTSPVSNDISDQSHLYTSGAHKFYRSYSPFVHTNISAAPTNKSTSDLYISVINANSGPVDTGYSNYKVPVKTTCGQAQPTCTCAGRTQTCSVGSTVVSTTPNATACRIQTSCSVSSNGVTATFNINTTNALGSLTYKDADTNQTISNPVTKNFSSGESVTQRTIVTDLFDNTQSESTCTAYKNQVNNGSEDEISSSTDDVSTIIDFTSRPSVVQKGGVCKFSWYTENMLLCSFKVNNVAQSGLQNEGRSNEGFNISTLDGNNKTGILTCISSTTPAETITATTTCRVNPEVRQQ